MAAETRPRGRGQGGRDAPLVPAVRAEDGNPPYGLGVTKQPPHIARRFSGDPPALPVEESSLENSPSQQRRSKIAEPPRVLPRAERTRSDRSFSLSPSFFRGECTVRGIDDGFSQLFARRHTSRTSWPGLATPPRDRTALVLANNRALPARVERASIRPSLPA